MRLAVLMLASSLVPELAAAGGWTLSSTTDPMTDQTMRMLNLNSEEGDVELVIACHKNNLVVMTNWNRFLTTDKNVDVLQRFDTKPADDFPWRTTGDHKSLIHPWREADSLRFVRELAATDRFMARVTPYGESSVTATFKLAGLGESLPKLEGCVE